MRKILVLLLAAVLFCPERIEAQASKKKNPEIIILKHVDILDVETKKVLEDMDIRIVDGIIQTIKKGIETRETDEQVLEMGGKYVIPGLIDSHAHIANGSRVSYDDGVKQMEYLLAKGVTSIRDMGGDARLLSTWKRAVDIEEIEGPDIYYAAQIATREYYKTPHTNKSMMGGMEEEFCAWQQLVEPGDDLDAVMLKAKATGATGIKIYYGYNKEYTKQIVDACNRHGLMSWSHVTLFPARPSEVVAAGVKVVSHAYMLEWEGLDNKGSDSKSMEIRAKEIDRGNIDISDYIKYSLEKDAILDATFLITAGWSSADYCYDLVRQMYLAGVKISAGTDWIIDYREEFPGIYSEMDLLISKCGFTNMDAIRSATIISAETLGGEQYKGSIKEGKDADLIVLNKNPLEDISNLKAISIVIKGGKIVQSNN